MMSTLEVTNLIVKKVVLPERLLATLRDDLESNFPGVTLNDKIWENGGGVVCELKIPNQETEERVFWAVKEFAESESLEFCYIEAE